MSSMETPEDPDTPPASEAEIRRAVRNWLLSTGCMVAMALVVIGLGEASGRIHFF